MSDSNVALVNQAYDAFGRGDIDALLDTLDPAVVWTTPGPDDLPSAGIRRGPDQVRQFFQTLVELYEFEDFRPQTFIAQGDHVVVLGIDTVKVRATGTVISEGWAHVMTIRDGRIVAFREYLDTAAVVDELRLVAEED